MRLADIAKELRITTQELRRELEKTNFGISPTTHEVEENLGKGVLRFLKGRVKPTLTHRRVAVIFKDGKEERTEKEKEEGMTEKPKEKKRGRKKGDEVSEAPPSPVMSVPIPPDRSRVPKAGAPERASGPSLHVSHRIEIEKSAAPVNLSELPHHYYKSKKKRKGRVSEEEAVLETLRRHPRVSKTRVAKVTYEAGEEAGNLTAEELAIEREDDRERFRAQKKHRALGQKKGPKAQPQIKAKVGVVEIPPVLSVKEFSEKGGLPVPDVISTLLKNGIMATVNQKIDYETAAIVAQELGVEVKPIQSEATAEQLFIGDLKILLKEEDPTLLTHRPPIVTVMGHVDHGKTKLLDTIRHTNIVATESGGITQHIGAYQVEKNGKKITFLDTPGHEAFTAMRARGAKVTDIAILVVAADEGVKPQTVEAIHHAKEAGVPVIVALNKMDKPDINPDRVKGELSEHGLQPEEWGGKTIMVPVSALNGEGIDTLLEMILLVAELENLKANPKRLAVGTVIESHLDPSLGPVATVLVNTGTLHRGDNIVAGLAMGRVKTMQDHLGRPLAAVPPAGAARIAGLDRVPQAGDLVQATKDEKTARARLEEIQALYREKESALRGSMVERIVSEISRGNMTFLKIVLKADTKGSLEAIMQALSKIKSETVGIKVIHFGVGNIADSDVTMAAASQALLVGFHVEANAYVQRLAEKERVDIKLYTIIYKLIEDLKAILSGMLEPEIRTLEIGKVEIKQIFLDKKSWLIGGGKVTEGKVQSKSMVRVKHGGATLFETELLSLKHVREDVSELEKGSDCGFKINTPKPVQVGDILEVFKIEKIQRKLE